MTASDVSDTLQATVDVDYGQWYLFDADAAVEAITGLVDDAVGTAELWEHRCASSGGGAIVYTLKQHGHTEVVVRATPDMPPLDALAEHVVECSLVIGGGRLAISGWESSVIAGVLRVSDQPLRVRISWFGLAHDLETDSGTGERFEVDVVPGQVRPVEVVRQWPPWTPPAHESTTPDGRRRYTGARAVEVRTPMEWIPLLFWPPYPGTADGTVTSLWRDPTDDSRWASGTGEGSHGYLRELSPEEADDLQVQGFPSVHTYAVDDDGRVWTSSMMPLERVPCLNLVPPWQFEMVKGITGGLIGTAVIDLPPGWDRLIRRPRDGGPPVQVDAIDDASDDFFQRWRDDQPAPAT